MPNEQFGIDPESPKFLYKEIVEAMRYDYVQKSVYPKIINQLGIKTCVYCNAQYAFSYDNGKDSFQNYEIDHWMPKSKYPYLCTSFSIFSRVAPSVINRNQARMISFLFVYIHIMEIN